MSDINEKCSVATQTNIVDLELQVTFWRERAVDCEKQNKRLRNLVKDKDKEIKQLIEDNKSLSTKLDDFVSDKKKPFCFVDVIHKISVLLGT